MGLFHRLGTRSDIILPKLVTYRILRFVWKKLKLLGGFLLLGLLPTFLFAIFTRGFGHLLSNLWFIWASIPVFALINVFFAY